MDIVADLLTRIRNAGLRRHKDVYIPYSKFKESILEFLLEQKYIDAFDVRENVRISSSIPNLDKSGDVESGKPLSGKYLNVSLKYCDGKHVISTLKRYSKPSRRMYFNAEDIAKKANMPGIFAISTNRGIMPSDKDCKIGGEVLFYVL